MFFPYILSIYSFKDKSYSYFLTYFYVINLLNIIMEKNKFSLATNDLLKLFPNEPLVFLNVKIN